MDFLKKYYFLIGIITFILIITKLNISELVVFMTELK